MPQDEQRHSVAAEHARVTFAGQAALHHGQRLEIVLVVIANLSIDLAHRTVRRTSPPTDLALSESARFPSAARSPSGVR
jgi:hypothetical protein